MQEKSKIVCRIFGGLGNQLFIYAAARRLAIVNNAVLVIDDKSGFIYDYDFNRNYQLDHFHIASRKATSAERLEPFARARRFVMRSWSKCSIPLFGHGKYIIQSGMTFDENLLDLRFNGTLYLEGYWQSEKYFKDVKDVIVQELQIKAPEDSLNRNVATQIISCIAVAVHIRFFNNPEIGSMAQVQYYARAFEYMEMAAPGAHYFIFSDKPEQARMCIKLPEDRFTMVAHNQGDENAYADLWLMTQCKHFIIANSTFSWWGAWLALSEGKIVIAPNSKNILMARIDAWSFDGLIPDAWVQL